MDMNSSRIEENKIFSTIDFFRKIYVGLIFVQILQIVFSLAGLSDDSNASETIVYFFALLIDISIYYGLKKKREWVISLVLFSSAIIILRGILMSASVVNNIVELIGKFFVFVLILFAVYQIFFFTKKEVKKVFSDKGSAIF
jgi:hypothetical protein